MMRPRVFVSHASEDKDAIARPLAYALKARGFEVWFDEFSLKLGQSLLSSIDVGLRDCDYGIVVLSPTFFAKKWPKRELAGLVALEDRGAVVLPVLHELTIADLAQYSPVLSDRLGVSTADGLEHVVDRLVVSMRTLHGTRPDEPGNYFLVPYTTSGPDLIETIRTGLAPAPDAPIQMHLYSDASGLDSDASYIGVGGGARRTLRSSDVLSVLSSQEYIPPGYHVRHWAVSDELPDLLDKYRGKEEMPIDFADVPQVFFAAVLDEHFVRDDELVACLVALINYDDGLAYRHQDALWLDPDSPGRTLVKRVVRTGQVGHLIRFTESDWEWSWVTDGPTTDPRRFWFTRSLVIDMDRSDLQQNPRVTECMLGERSPLNPLWKRRVAAKLRGNAMWVDDERGAEVEGSSEAGSGE